MVSPKCSLKGRISARNDDGIEGRGVSKKRMLICNGSDRGSNFASIRKDANLLMVFSCVNRNKPMNVRCSTTPRGVRLTDSFLLVGCCPESQNQLKQLVPDRKGLKTLEPYEGKLSSTVPRRGEAGNCFFLSD